jgi:hypothetical protein
MPICSHRSLDGFGILHLKLLENILNVLCLANEGTLLELLDLKSKEILQLPHHGHVKFLYHNSTKLFTRWLVSRPKKYIININLAYKKSLSIVLVKIVGSAFPTLKPLIIKKVSQTFIPCSWGSFEPIKHL